MSEFFTLAEEHAAVRLDLGLCVCMANSLRGEGVARLDGAANNKHVVDVEGEGSGSAALHLCASRHAAYARFRFRVQGVG